jgi:hypothetical protein
MSCARSMFARKRRRINGPRHDHCAKSVLIVPNASITRDAGRPTVPRRAGYLDLQSARLLSQPKPTGWVSACRLPDGGTRMQELHSGKNGPVEPASPIFAERAWLLGSNGQSAQHPISKLVVKGGSYSRGRRCLPLSRARFRRSADYRTAHAQIPRLSYGTRLQDHCRRSP